MAVSSFPYGNMQPALRVSLLGGTAQHFSLTPTDATASYSIVSSGPSLGLEQKTQGGSTTTIGNWLRTGSLSDYDVRATLNSGTSPAGSGVGTWLNLGTSRFWSLTDTGPVGPPITCNLTIEIRDASTLAVLTSAVVVITVQESA